MGEKMLAVIACVGLLMLGSILTYSEYAKKECRIEFLKAGKTAEEIKAVCR